MVVNKIVESETLCLQTFELNETLKGIGSSEFFFENAERLQMFK